MAAPNDKARFTETVLSHLDDAYNLARWLTHDPADAADVVQEAMLRALRFFDKYRGGNAKSWLLAIVHNAAIDLLRSRQKTARMVLLSDENEESASQIVNNVVAGEDPETALIRADDYAQLDQLIAALAPEFRECLVLRELEELSYREIAAVMGTPIGTVMSRLSRARQLIHRSWKQKEKENA